MKLVLSEVVEHVAFMRCQNNRDRSRRKITKFFDHCGDVSLYLLLIKSSMCCVSLKMNRIVKARLFDEQCQVTLLYLY